MEKPKAMSAELTGSKHESNADRGGPRGRAATVTDDERRALARLLAEPPSFDRLFTAILRSRRSPDRVLSDDAALGRQLELRLEDLIDRALIARDPVAYLDYQRALRAFIDLKTSSHNNPLELSAHVNFVGNRLVERWIEQELRDVHEDALPKAGEDLLSWIGKTVETHPAADHPVYAYIEQYADVAQFRYFVTQEQTVDATFADLIALCQLGAAASYKFEMAENYWDEMGHGSIEQAHATIFSNMLRTLGVAQSTGDQLTAGALAGGNLLMALSLYRCYYQRAIGALACTEIAVFRRFTRISAAARRLELPENVVHYYQMHVDTDAEHADGWLKRVVRPLVESEESQEIAREIARGVLLRLAVSQRYCDELLERLQAMQRTPPARELST